MRSLREEFVERRQGGRRLAALTAYDFPMGRLLDEAGLDFILVGDSLGMVTLGMADTVDVTLEAMIHHTRAVARGVTRTPLVADLPRCVSGSPDVAVKAACCLLEAGARGVKIEGGLEVLPHVEALRGSVIEVIGHLGMLPQRVREEGGYSIKGRREEEAKFLLESALALERAGVAAIVLELVEKTLAGRITESLRIPTIGIGSGQGCAGQILVTHDLLGLTPWFRPAFVRPRAELAREISRAVGEFVREVHGGSPELP